MFLYTILLYSTIGFCNASSKTRGVSALFERKDGGTTYP